MKKVPMILLLIAPYAIVFLCDQTGLDFSIGLWIYGTLLAFYYGVRISAAEAGIQGQADPVLESAAEAMEYSIGADDPAGHFGNITGWR